MCGKPFRTQFALTETQAQAILDMRLQRLTQLEQEKILSEHRETLGVIDSLQSILASPEKIDGVIKEELTDLRSRFSDERRTQIQSASGRSLGRRFDS